MAPAVLFWAYYERYSDPEHLEEELKARYRSDIAKNTQKNEQMKEFFQQAMYQKGSQNNKNQQDISSELDHLLREGKGGSFKRFSAVDREVYGTAEGAQTREQAWSEAKQKLKQKNKRKEATPPTTTPTNASPSKRSKQKVQTTDQSSQVQPSSGASLSSPLQSTVTLVGIAAVAASLGFVLGNTRKQ